MPLPFTGLQSFRWGDGVQVIFFFAILVVGDNADMGGW